MRKLSKTLSFLAAINLAAVVISASWTAQAANSYVTLNDYLKKDKWEVMQFDGNADLDGGLKLCEANWLKDSNTNAALHNKLIRVNFTQTGDFKVPSSEAAFSFCVRAKNKFCQNSKNATDDKSGYSFDFSGTYMRIVTYKSGSWVGTTDNSLVVLRKGETYTLEFGALDVADGIKLVFNAYDKTGKQIKALELLDGDALYPNMGHISFANMFWADVLLAKAADSSGNQPANSQTTTPAASSAPAVSSPAKASSAAPDRSEDSNSQLVNSSASSKSAESTASAEGTVSNVSSETGSGKSGKSGTPWLLPVIIIGIALVVCGGAVLAVYLLKVRKIGAKGE